MRVVTLLLSGALAVLPTAGSLAQTATKPAAAPAAKDRFPNGCVDCHVAVKDDKGKTEDQRLSTLMAAWTAKVEPKLLEAAKAASTDATKVKGKHPKAPVTGKSVPSSCMTCHKRDSKTAPALSRLMHLVHLRADTKTPVTCADCHKLDAKTGNLTVPSAVEK